MFLHKYFYKLLSLLSFCYVFVTSSFVHFFINPFKFNLNNEIVNNKSTLFLTLFNHWKKPSHLVIIIGEDIVLYEDILQIVLWCMIAGVSFVSVYDSKDRLSHVQFYKVLMKSKLFQQGEGFIHRLKLGFTFDEFLKHNVSAIDNGTRLVNGLTNGYTNPLSINGNCLMNNYKHDRCLKNEHDPTCRTVTNRSIVNDLNYSKSTNDTNKNGYRVFENINNDPFQTYANSGTRVTGKTFPLINTTHPEFDYNCLNEENGHLTTSKIFPSTNKEAARELNFERIEIVNANEENDLTQSEKLNGIQRKLVKKAYDSSGDLKGGIDLSIERIGCKRRIDVNNSKINEHPSNQNGFYEHFPVTRNPLMDSYNRSKSSSIEELEHDQLSSQKNGQHNIQFNNQMHDDHIHLNGEIINDSFLLNHDIKNVSHTTFNLNVQNKTNVLRNRFGTNQKSIEPVGTNLPTVYSVPNENYHKFTKGFEINTFNADEEKCEFNESIVNKKDESNKTLVENEIVDINVTENGGLLGKTNFCKTDKNVNSINKSNTIEDCCRQSKLDELLSNEDNTSELLKNESTQINVEMSTELNLLTRKQMESDLFESIVALSRRKDVEVDNINTELFASELYARCPLPDPELAIVVGSKLCTYGALPWNIRLTQFFQMNSNCYEIKFNQFEHVMRKFGKCEQRYGK